MTTLKQDTFNRLTTNAKVGDCLWDHHYGRPDIGITIQHVVCNQELVTRLLKEAGIGLPMNKMVYCIAIPNKDELNSSNYAYNYACLYDNRAYIFSLSF
jgi:hypothetical protein